jgi:putative tricarboxylic transport membrane protein
MEEKIPKRPGERIFLWFNLLISIFILINAFRMPHESFSSYGSFPILVGSIMALTILWVLIKDRARLYGFKIGEEFRKTIPFAFPGTISVYAGIIILYILLLNPLHFWLGSYLFLIGSFLFLKGTTPLRSLFIAAGLLGAIYLVFQFIFKIILW